MIGHLIAALITGAVGVLIGGPLGGVVLFIGYFVAFNRGT
jgi:hypothetical protein